MIVALLFAKNDSSLVLFRHTVFFKKMRKTFKLMRKVFKLLRTIFKLMRKSWWEKSGSREVKILVSNQGTIVKAFYSSVFGYQNLDCIYFCIVMTQAKYMKKVDCVIMSAFKNVPARTVFKIKMANPIYTHINQNSWYINLQYCIWVS
jgi:hypothetical protein